MGGSGRRGVQSVTGRVTGERAEMDQGARAIFELSKRLKAVGGVGKGSVLNEMNAALRLAAKPLPSLVAKEAERRFPERGGLSKVMSKRKPRIAVRRGVKTAGIRLQDRRTDPRMNAQGRIYHPLFGRKGSDVVQIVPGVAGYFEESIEAEAPAIRVAVVQVLREYTIRLAKGL